MATTEQRTLFAFDCGATNWRLYRSQYDLIGNRVHLIGEPSPSPLTSFIDRRLPAVLLLTPDGTELECYGEMAQSQVDDEANRLRIRDYFKPCIGAHLDSNPEPHQLRYTHQQALTFTRLMLDAVLAQLLREKWRTGSFDERAVFSFAYPVHWQTAHDGVIFDDFSKVVKNCLPEEVHKNIRFVSEPEGAILSLKRQGHLDHLTSGKSTLIVDVGGSTTDLVAGEVDSRSGELIFIGRYGESFGGGHYDTQIANSIADELRIPASAIAEDPGALLSLRNVAKRLKESLSRQLLFDNDTSRVPQRTVTLVMRDGEIFRGGIKLDKDKFNELTGNLLLSFKNLIESGLTTIGLDEGNIGQIVLVGGGAQLFSIIQHLEERFPGIDLILADNPDESVVVGTSLEYGAASERARPSLLFMGNIEGLAAESVLKEKEDEIEEKNYIFESALGDIIHLIEGENRVGRSASNEIHIPAEKISRHHARLLIAGDNLELIDLGSTNGSFVNDVRLEKIQPVPLNPGDEVRFGDHSFELKLSS
jgi:molecular chaperone DnaK (HSP70)